MIDLQEWGELVEKVTHLVYLGLKHPKGLSTNREFQELLRNYQHDSLFRVTLRSIINGLELEILEIGPSGLFLSPRPNSLFAMKRSIVGSFLDKDYDKYTGLILIGLAAYYFPGDSQFDEESIHSTSPITVEKLDQFLREKCQIIKEKEKPKDALAGEEMLELLLTSYLQLPNESHPESRSRSTSEFYIRRTLKFLIKEQLFIEKDGKYWPTVRFRLQMEDLAENNMLKNFLEINENWSANV